MNKHFIVSQVFSEIKTFVRTRDYVGPADEIARKSFLADLKDYTRHLSKDLSNQIFDFIDDEMSDLIFDENFKYNDENIISRVYKLYNGLEAKKLLCDLYFEDLCMLELEVEDFFMKIIKQEFENSNICTETSNLF